MTPQARRLPVLQAAGQGFQARITAWRNQPQPGPMWENSMVDDKPQVTDLYALELDENLFAEVTGTTLAYAPINDHEDTYAVRDMSNLDAGTLRVPGTALRKLGVIL